MIKLIHPKTGTVREVAESNANKQAILARAGFVPLEGYKAPKPKKKVPDPSVSDIVKKHKLEGVDPEDAPAAEVAIHVSAAARNMIKKNDLDPALIEGTGKNGQITKTDVKKHLKALEESAEELPEQPPEPVVRAATEEEEEAEKALSAEDILTHDDDPPEEAQEPEADEDVEEVADEAGEGEDGPQEPEEGSEEEEEDPE